MAVMPTCALMWLGRRVAARGICLSFQLGQILRTFTVSPSTSASWIWVWPQLPYCLSERVTSSCKRSAVTLILNEIYFLLFSVCPKGIILTETSGVITSPFNPRNYPDNQNCSWQITARQGNRVKLVISDTLNIQECGSLCTCDYLKVQNGFSADLNGNEKICGFPFKYLTYYSTFESLKVLFVSDDTGSKQYHGFKATYTQLNYTPPSKYCEIFSDLRNTKGAFCIFE